MILGLFAAAAVAASNPDLALGRWATETKHGIVQIDRCGSSICGRIVTSDGLRENPGRPDLNNKNPALRSRRLLGLQILGGFRTSGNQWTGGTIYNAEDGGTYNATLAPIDANHLKVRGCIVWPLCKTQVWTRVR
jgi:uncharacterized protein (DUF2147 family)